MAKGILTTTAPRQPPAGGTLGLDALEEAGPDPHRRRYRHRYDRQALSIVRLALIQLIRDLGLVIVSGADDGREPRAVTVVYTDGGCSPNPGPGGWAWAVPAGPWVSGSEADSTNQRMEITAVLEAIKALDGPLEVFSDSAYVVNCFRERWWVRWLERDWIGARRRPVANRDLWEPLVQAVSQRDITFRKVKGHSGDPMNDLVDQLAAEARRNQRGRRGSDLGVGGRSSVAVDRDPRRCR